MSSMTIDAINYIKSVQIFTEPSFYLKFSNADEELVSNVLNNFIEKKLVVQEPIFIYRFLDKKNNDESSIRHLEPVWDYASKVKSFTIESAQEYILIPYEEMKNILSSLIELGFLEYTAALGYAFTNNEELVDSLINSIKQRDHLRGFSPRRRNFFRDFADALDDNDLLDDDNDDDDGINENAIDFNLFNILELEDENWKEFKVHILKKCVKEKIISDYYLNTQFSLDQKYISKLIDWMKKSEYISDINPDTLTYKILLDEKGFDRECVCMGYKHLSFEASEEDSVKSNLFSSLHYLNQKNTIKNKFKNLFPLSETEAHETNIAIGLFYPDCSPYNFTLNAKDDGCYLSDNGLTMQFLRKSINLEEKNINSKIETILNTYGIELKNDEIVLKINMSSTSLLSLFFFISAINKLTGFVE